MTEKNWCPGFDDARRAQFVGHVAQQISARFGGCEIDEDAGVAKAPGAGCYLGLGNLAQECRRADPSVWPELVATHFGRLAEYNDGPLEAFFETMLSDFDKILPKLRIKVATAAQLGTVDPVANKLPFDLYGCLVADLGDAICYVTHDHTDNWWCGSGEAMAIGVANTVAFEPLEPTGTPSDTAGYWVLENGSMFASGHLLDLGHIFGGARDSGAVVMAPRANTLVACEADPDDVQGTAKAVAAAVTGGLQLWFEGPNPISPSVLWWRPGCEIEGLLGWEEGKGFVGVQELGGQLRREAPLEAFGARSAGVEV